MSELIQLTPEQVAAELGSSAELIDLESLRQLNRHIETYRHKYDCLEMILPLVAYLQRWKNEFPSLIKGEQKGAE